MKTVSICTLGCRVNQYESRAIAELFVKQGYTLVELGEKCDVCIINTCAVTAESERKSAQMIRRAKRFAGEVRVCGCFAERDKSLAAQSPFITQCTGCSGKTALAGVKPLFTDRGFELANIATVPFDGAKTFSSTRAYIKIQDGCNGRCTYCIIPSLRGRSRSRPPEDILAEIARLAAAGYKEVILTGIETAAYNYEPLYRLLERVAAVSGIERIRLGSLDPNALNADFINAAATLPKIMPHFHISLQSGCDRILRLMGRPYTAAAAKERIEALKAAVPTVRLSADIICSFPTETEKELDETLAYINSIGFSHIHAFSYSKRPGTPAADMQGQIPEEEKKRRMRKFLEECAEMEEAQRESKVGTCDTVLVEKTDGGYAFGHTDDFFEAKIKSDRLVNAGDLIKVKIIGTSDDKLLCTEA